jgi:hypothetical protein
MSPDPEADVLTPEVTTEAPPTDAAEAVEGGTPNAEQAPRVSAETTAKARDMGWVPQNEWRGSPDAWRPADQFVKRGEEVLPIVRSNLERERRKVQDLEKSTKEQMAALQADFDKRSARLEKMTGIALQNQRERMWGEFEEKKRSAVADGNILAYDKHNQDQRQALSEFNADTEPEEPAPAPAKKADAQPQTQAPPEVQTWVEQNRWFNRDATLTAFATEVHGRLLKEMPGLSVEENLQKTTEATRAKFPEKFGVTPPTNGQAQPHAPGVEGGGRQAQGGGREKSWNDLPPEAKQAAKGFFEDGLFGADEDMGKAQKSYAKKYWEQEI